MIRGEEGREEVMKRRKSKKKKTGNRINKEGKMTRRGMRERERNVTEKVKGEEQRK